jgi:enediyne biosynthesis protein E4
MLLLALFACLPDDDPAPLPEAEPSKGFPGFALIEPVLAGPELAPGATSVFDVETFPGARVTLVRSTAGEGDGPCFGEPPVCAGLREAVEVATATADAAGVASFAVETAPDEPPDALWLQALVYEPSTGAIPSNVIARHVLVPSSASPLRFKDIAEAAGIDTFTTGNSHTGGVAWCDVNNDLWPDLFVSNGGGAPHYLFLNLGNGYFRDASDRVPKPDPQLEGGGVSCGDLDNDGDEDIVVAIDSPVQLNAIGINPREGGPNLLYRNDGGGRFTEIAADAGILDPRGWRNITVSLADYDRDGWLDLYLGVWAIGAAPTDVHDRTDRLLHNDGDGTFTEVSGAGVPDGRGLDNLATLWFDADGDLFPDLYVGNTAHVSDPPDWDPTNVLYRNLGDGTFLDANDASPGFGDDAWAAMGSAAFDLEHDGDWDLFVTDVYYVDDPPPHGNPLYVNQGDGTFADNRCDVAGICGGFTAWAANFVDLDLDGWEDLYVGNSDGFHHPSDPDYFYLNQRDGTFDLHMVDFPNTDPRGAAHADYDGDGDLDLAVWDDGAPSWLFRNDSARGENHWIEISLNGTASNRSAIGAEVALVAGGTLQKRRVSGGDSFHSNSDKILHFGLGASTAAEQVVVRWPSGAETVVDAIPADVLYRIDEAEGVVKPRLDGATATWSGGDLVIEATTNYGGRLTVQTEGYGAVPWDAELGVYRAVFPVDPAPSSVVVAAGADDLAVTVTVP